MKFCAASASLGCGVEGLGFNDYGLAGTWEHIFMASTNSNVASKRKPRRRKAFPLVGTE
jgi:hypothetical protein